MRKLDRYDVTRDGDKQHKVAYQHRWVVDTFGKGLDYEDVIVLSIDTHKNRAFKQAVVYDTVDDRAYVIERFKVTEVDFKVYASVDGEYTEWDALASALGELAIARSKDSTEYGFVFLHVEGQPTPYVWGW